MPTPELQEFFAKIQGRDEAAVQAMLREMDPFLRRVIHMRLLDGRLRRAVDTTDILQSLIEDFLRQPAAGEPAETSSAELCAYLAAAVRHKVQTRLRKERRHLGSLPEEWDPASPEPDVGKCVENQDFVAAIRGRLDESARLLLDLKAQGLTWQEVASKVGGRADALRMRLNRAIAAVLTELEEEEKE
jgi:RNA polymerase sigma factor (sigma-70 family)